MVETFKKILNKRNVTTWLRSKQSFPRAVAVAQLVEQSLSILEVRSLNPVMGKIYIEHLFTVKCIEKTKIKKTGPFFNK